MNVGQLNKIITIQIRTMAQDDAGQPTESWRTFAQCYANIKPKVGKDYLESKQLINEITHDITIRYRRHIKPKMRILYEDRIFEIVAPPIDPEEKRRWLYLKCKELVED